MAHNRCTPFNRFTHVLPVLFLLGLNLMALSQPAKADEVEDFYHGKTISIIVGYSHGGGFDKVSRIFAKHFTAHMPGHPNVIVQNMPGAGSMVAANFVANTSPRDGTVIGNYNDMMLVAPLLSTAAAKFDPRQFGWLGSFASRPTPVIFVRSDSPATTMQEAREKVDLIAATGPDATSSYALMSNDLFGTKFKVIMGYKGGSSDMNLAIERGEAHGRASWDWFALNHDKPDWVKKDFVKVLVQLSLERNPDPALKAIPYALELAKSEEEKMILELVLGTGKFLRAYSVPPGVPPARLEALRKAFKETTNDPAFITELVSVYPPGLDYQTPSQIEAFMAKVYTFPKNVIERSAKYVGE